MHFEEQLISEPHPQGCTGGGGLMERDSETGEKGQKRAEEGGR